MTVNDSTPFMNKPTVLNVTDNRCETTMDINTATEFNSNDPEPNSTVIVVTSNSNPTGMDFTTNITNLTFNDTTFVTYKSESNSTVSGSTIALQQSNSTTADNVLTHEPKLNCMINYSTNTTQQLNSVNNSSVNSMNLSANAEFKPDVINSTRTNTSIVVDEYTGL
ncbi:Hypothetical protein CINCED_3A003078 [Cinara cedri]|uniref:Uncharacterized protein n=1 Tax=Cinara cedri TaxID=506608 RepID=A0A5E4N491_9HEMI|nr:Hypothetical protein CINCED_3A003078 [Cinara cedri]